MAFKKSFLFLFLIFVSSYLSIFSAFFDYAKCEVSFASGVDASTIKSSNFEGGANNFSFDVELNPIRFRFKNEDKGLYVSIPFAVRYNSLTQLSARRFMDESWDYMAGLRVEYYFINKLGGLLGSFYGVEYYPLQNSASAVLRLEGGLKYKLTPFLSLGVKEGWEKVINKSSFSTDFVLSIST